MVKKFRCNKVFYLTMKYKLLNCCLPFFQEEKTTTAEFSALCTFTFSDGIDTGHASYLCMLKQIVEYWDSGYKYFSNSHNHLFSAMAFLAASFTDDSMRLRATSIAFSGFTVGVTSKLYN